MKTDHHYSMLLAAPTIRTELTQLVNDLKNVTSRTSFETAGGHADLEVMKQWKEDKVAQLQSVLDRLCLSGQWPELPLTVSGEQYAQFWSHDAELSTATENTDHKVEVVEGTIRESSPASSVTMDTQMASPDADDTTPAERADSLPPQADTAATEAIEAQYARFERLTERLSKLEFEATMQDGLWKEEVDQYIQRKVKQVRSAASQHVAPRVPGREACPELAEELDEIQAALRDTGEQVAELTQDHFKLIREKQEL